MDFEKPEYDIKIYQIDTTHYEFKKNELNLEKIENLLLSLDLNNQDEIRIQIEKIKSNSQTEMPEKKHVIPNLNHLKK